MKKHLIWGNYDLDPKDWQDFLEDNDLLEADEYDQYNAIAEMNNVYLDDERSAFRYIQKNSLDIRMNGYNDYGCILAIADLGLWNGRVTGYKVVNSLEDILYSDCDYAEWWCDSQLRSKQSHHDGTNYITYVFFSGRDDGYNNTRGEDKFLEDLYYGNPISKSRWYKYTRSIAPYIKKYYGWK